VQEAIGLTVFTVVALFIFKGEQFHWRYALAFVFIVAAVWLVFGGAKN
jgi:uncharacterized protein (DUF486 family)